MPMKAGIFFILLALLFSCNPDNSKDDGATSKGTNVLILPDTVELSWDSISTRRIDKIKPAEKLIYPVDSVDLVKVCALREAGGKSRLRIKVDYRTASGKSWNVTNGDLVPGGAFYFEFSPPDKGELIVTIQEKKLFWLRRELTFESTPITCWPPKFEAPKAKKMRGPVTVKTTDSSAKNATVSVEQ